MPSGSQTKPRPSGGAVRRLQQLSHQLKIAGGARAGRVLTGPLYVQIGVVNSCNYRCQFCWDHPTFVDKQHPYPDKVAENYYEKHPEIDRNKARMNWDMYTALVDDLHDLGTRKIKFIGRGESFLHDRFVDMVEYAKRRDFNCSITTNGSLISDENVRALVEIGLDELFVSVNAASPKTYGEIHIKTPPSMFERIKDVLKLFASEKKRRGVRSPFTNLSFVIQNNNYFEMPDMVSLAKEVGAQRVAFVRISVYEGTKFLILSQNQNMELMEKYLVEAEKRAAELGIETNFDLFRGRPSDAQRSRAIHTTTPCYIGWYFSIILADGTVNPCCECLRAIGTLQTERFKDIWFGEKYLQFREEINKLPEMGQEVSGCRCYNCGFASHNLSLHRAIHPFSKAGGRYATFSFNYLKRFIFGA